MSSLVLSNNATRHAERSLRDLMGREHAEELLQQSSGCFATMPVAGSSVVVRDGVALPIMGGGSLSSFSDLIAKATAAGGRTMLPFNQVGTANVVGRGSTLWTVGPQPAVGAAPAALAAGDVPTRATTGAHGQPNPSGSNTVHHLTTQIAVGSVGPHTLVLVDRLWHGRPTTTAGVQSVTGAPNRYTGAGEAEGNIAFIEIATALPATAHTHTIVYTDQGGTGSNSQTVTGVSSGAVGTMDMAGLWFMPLLAGDTGVKEIDSYNVGTTLASGALNLVIAKPLLMIPLMMTNTPAFVDGVNSAFNLAQVRSDACLHFIVIPGSATATTFTGALEMVQAP